MHSRKWNREETYTFDIIQVNGRQIVGGYTVRLADHALLNRVNLPSR